MDTKLLSRLQNLCSKKECCSSDILAKATKALDGDVESAREILASLLEDKYIDDLRYASAFAREKSAISGWGPIKIKFALGAKKIPSSTIDEALKEIDSDKADEKLFRVVQAKAKLLSGDPQWRLKLLKFALSRGYSYDAVIKAVDRLDG